MSVETEIQYDFEAGDEVLIVVTFVDKTLPGKPLTDPGDATFLLQPGYAPADTRRVNIADLEHLGDGTYQYTFATDTSITADLECVAQAVATSGLIGTAKPYAFTVHPLRVPLSA